MHSLPIIRKVPCSGKLASLRDLDQIRRSLPARPVDDAFQCQLQDESGPLIRDEETSGGIFDDLSACPSPHNDPPSPPGTTRRGQRQFFDPNPQTTFGECSDIIDAATGINLLTAAGFGILAGLLWP